MAWERKESFFCLQHFTLVAAAGSNLQHLSTLPEAASCSSVINAENRAVNETEMASSSRCLKARNGEDIEQIKNCDHCCEMYRFLWEPHITEGLGMTSVGCLPIGTSSYWHKYIRMMAPNHILEDQLKLLPEVNIPLKNAGVNVQEFWKYLELFSSYINRSVIQQAPSALRLWGLSSEAGKAMPSQSLHSGWGTPYIATTKK